jgi:hypothetical protein
MAGGFGLAVAFLAVLYGALTTAFLWHLPLAVVFAFVAGGVGKWTGIAHARSRLTREMRSLIAAYGTRPTREV